MNHFIYLNLKFNYYILITTLMDRMARPEGFEPITFQLDFFPIKINNPPSDPSC